MNQPIILQSIFSFNGADACGFDSFRKDFPMYKEVRLISSFSVSSLSAKFYSFSILGFS